MCPSFSAEQDKGIIAKHWYDCSRYISLMDLKLDHLQSKCNVQMCSRIASNNLASSSSATTRRPRLHAKGHARLTSLCRATTIEQDQATITSDEAEHLSEFLQVVLTVLLLCFCLVTAAGESLISYKRDVANAGGAWWSSTGKSGQG